jgi:hypothetical protein
VTHATDADCTLLAGTHTCLVCSVYHGDPCGDCGGRAFHAEECPENIPDVPPPDPDACAFCAGSTWTDLGTRCTYCTPGRRAFHYALNRYGGTDMEGGE